MAADYPTGIKTFTTKDPGDPIQSAHINDLQNEVVAVETQLGVNAGTWLNWTPTLGAGDPMTFTSTTIEHARYTKIGKICYFTMRAEGTTGGTPSFYLTATLPFPFVNYAIFTTVVEDVYRMAGFSRPHTITGSNMLIICKYDRSNWGLGTPKRFAVSGFYEIA